MTFMKDSTAATQGIRTIESGNIRLSTQFKWLGQVQGTDKDFCVFGNYLPDRRELRRGYERGMGQLLVPSDRVKDVEEDEGLIKR